jgi:hypothetical protein
MARFVSVLTLLLLLLAPLAWAADDGQKDGKGQQTSTQAGGDKGQGKQKSGGGAEDPEPECD